MARERASRSGRTRFFRRVVKRIHTSLRNSRAKAHAGASPVSPTKFSPRPLTSSGDPLLKRAIPVRARSRRPIPVRRSERRAGRVSRTRPVRLTRFVRGLAPHLLVRRSASLHRRRAPIFQIVRSGLLRFKRAWLSVRVRPSPESGGGSSTVEHVNALVGFLLGFSFGQ
jgi:hypothetical protein